MARLIWWHVGSRIKASKEKKALTHARAFFSLDALILFVFFFIAWLL
jgi:hypothetical protein